MIKRIYLNLISQEINNKTHILINKQKDCVVLDKNCLGSSSYQNYFSLKIDEMHFVIQVQQINSERSWFFYWKETYWSHVKDWGMKISKEIE